MAFTYRIVSFDDEGSAIELSSDGTLGLRRSNEELFQICKITTVHMVQLIGTYHKLPESLKSRLIILGDIQ